jgi:choline-sulfatase
MDLVGVQTPPIFQGRSFAPLVRGESYEPRESVFIEYRDPFQSSWKAVRTHAHKYCRSGAGSELLFDLAADPGELTNLASDAAYAATLADMRHELLRRWYTVEKQYPKRTAAY